MPEIVVHNAMGDRVLNKLPTEVQCIINPEVFRFAVMGLDPYFFLQISFP